MRTRIPAERQNDSVVVNDAGVPQEVSRLVDHWRTLGGEDGSLPARQALNPINLGGLLADISLYDVDENGDYRVRLAGTALRGLHGCEITGRRLAETPDTASGGFWRGVLDTVRRCGRPAVGAELHADGLVRHYVRLPLSDDGRRITGILALDCLRYADAATA
jgi:hypothetical protein